MGWSAFRVYGAPDFLRKDVECFIVNSFNGEERAAINVFPSGIPGIVFHHNGGYPAIENIVTQSGRETSPPTLFLHGAGTESSVMNFAKGLYTVIQVILKPHALQALFGINALTLQGAAPALNELSTGDLSEQLMNIDGDPERVDLLTSFLATRLEQSRSRDDLMEDALRLIHQYSGGITVKTVLEHLDLSERQFERRFSQAVGISPLSYIRVRRFNEAVRLMKSGRYNTLTEIAYTLNFHDQSHFIRDIKTFTGITPKSLSQRVDDFVYNQAGYSY